MNWTMSTPTLHRFAASPAADTCLIPSGDSSAAASSVALPNPDLQRPSPHSRARSISTSSPTRSRDEQTHVLRQLLLPERLHVEPVHLLRVDSHPDPIAWLRPSFDPSLPDDLPLHCLGLFARDLLVAPHPPNAGESLAIVNVSSSRHGHRRRQPGSRDKGDDLDGRWERNQGLWAAVCMVERGYSWKEGRGKGGGAEGEGAGVPYRTEVLVRVLVPRVSVITLYVF